MTEVIKKYGREFVRTPDGGLIEKGASLPSGSTARIFDGAVVFRAAAENMRGGDFRRGDFRGGVFFGGDFWGGVFWGGEFRGGVFRGGVFFGGDFRGGVFFGGDFRGGVFRGGVFRDGVFWGGVFNGGWFRGGVFRGGEFRVSPACAQRSDGYMFVVHLVDGKLRVWAGCRKFSWDQAVAHWSNPDHPYSAESMRIINFLREQVEART
jgi:hypothetical protein